MRNKILPLTLLMSAVLVTGCAANGGHQYRADVYNPSAVNRAQDSVVAQAWTSYLERGLDWTESKKVEEQILALTVEDVNKAIRRFADPENLTIVLAGDREKAKEAGKDFFAK